MAISSAVLEGRRIEIQGTVQGVGFRPWVYRTAHESGVTGRVHNDAAGVTIEAFGDFATLERFIERLHVDPPPAARIRAFQQSPIPVELERDFVIVPTVDRGLCEVDFCSMEIAGDSPSI